MRISTSMIYQTGIRAINDQTSSMLHTQQQLSSGRRIVTPSDDPVAASRALVVTEAQDINTQFGTNQGNAKDLLGLQESQMSSLNDLLTRVRQLAVNAGDGALSPTDLKSISAELRSRFEELLGIANTTDSNGDYLFSGNMGNTKPFGANVDNLMNSGGEVTYAGDSGLRSLQVSATRFLQVSNSGADIFRQVRNGNGSFVTDYARTNTGTGVIDAGSVTNTATWNGLADKNYSVQFWVDSAGVAGTPGTTYYDLVDTTTGNSMITGAAAVNPPTTAADFAAMRRYYDNQTIQLSTQTRTTPPAEAAFDLGANINITGAPANGDSFSIAPATTQSVFKTIANLIGAVEGQQYSTLTGTAYVAGAADAGGTFNLTVNGVTKTLTIPAATYTPITLASAINTAITDPVNGFGYAAATATGSNGRITLSAPAAGSASAGISVAGGTLAVASIFTTAPTAGTMTRNSTGLANQIAQALTNLDQDTDNVLRVRSGIGARMNELDSLSNVNQDLNLRYSETLSSLQDVDYAKSISDLQQNQSSLDAAQKSYMKVTQLSLFQYL
jgi:flagellar hook-associated protein 3 FlgL